jgi:hypothetical protein
MISIFLDYLSQWLDYVDLSTSLSYTPPKRATHVSREALAAATAWRSDDSP